jgi:hypothetical protein
MKAINKTATKIMDKLTANLNEAGAARKIDNTEGTFMPVCVERLMDSDLGPVFSVAHYYTQNGDAMRDPEMEFIKGFDGKYYPRSFLMDPMPEQRSVEIVDGNIRFAPRMQKDQAVFAGTWMRNIKIQQGTL